MNEIDKMIEEDRELGIRVRVDIAEEASEEEAMLAEEWASLILGIPYKEEPTITTAILAIHQLGLFGPVGAGPAGWISCFGKDEPTGLLDLMMPNRKRLRDCTADEVREAADFLVRVADTVDAKVAKPQPRPNAIASIVEKEE